MQTYLTTHKKDLLLLAALFLTAAFPFIHLLFQNNYLIYSSDINYFFGHEIINRQLLGDRTVPLWNPYFGGGAPQLGKLQVSLFYPVSMLLRWLPLVPMFNWDAVLHIFLAGAGVFVLLRRWRTNRTAAFAGALIFMFSGAVMPRVIIGHAPVIHVIAWTGWVLWAYDRLLQRRAWSDLLLTVMFALLILLGGHLQISALVLFIPVAYFGLFVLTRLSNWRTLVTPFFQSGLVAVLTVGLVAVQLLPYLEWLGLTGRGQGLFIENLASMTRNSLNPEGLLTILAPLLLFSPVPQHTLSLTGFSHYWETSPYFTVAGLFLLAFGFGRVQGARRNQIRFLIGLTAAGLFMSMGRQNPLYEYLYLEYPYFRAPGRFLLWWAFGLALLAGFALNAALQAWPNSRRQRRMQQAAAALAVLAALLWGGYQLWGPALIESLKVQATFSIRDGRIALESVPRSLQQLFFTALGLSILFWLGQTGRLARSRWRYGLLLLILAESWAVTWFLLQPYPVSLLRRPDHPLALLTTDPASIRVDGAREPPAYLTPTLIHVFNGDEYFRLERLMPEAGDRGRRILAGDFLPSPNPIDDPAYVLVQQANGAYLYEHVDNFPRIYAAGAIMPVSQDDEALAFLLSESFVPTRQAVLTLPAGGAVPNLPLAPGDPAVFSGRYVNYGNNAFTAVVETDRPVLVVFNEMAYPGWEASLDNDPVPIYRSNYAFRGIVLEAAGSYEIEMTFRPRSYRIGLGLSSVTALAILLATILLYWRRPANETS